MIYKVLLPFLILTATDLVFSFTNNFPCVQKSPCRCEYPDGTSINLEPSLNNSFLIATNTSVAYFYSPCIDLELPAAKLIQTRSALWLFKAINQTNVTLNAQDVFNGTVNGTFAPLVSSASGVFKNTEKIPNKAQLIYNVNSTIVTVELTCSQQVQKSFEIASGPSNHTLHLTSVYVCPKYYEDDNNEGLSTGSQLVILFLIFVGTYFFVGMLIKRSWGLQGIELIPHIDFFRNLQGLVKDGIKFVFSCGQSVQCYDQI